MLPSKRQWKNWTIPSKMSFLGSLSSILGIMSLQIYFLLIPTHPNGTIDQKIKELDNTQVALSTLTQYVATQKSNLEALSKQKQNLEFERERIQKILDVDQEKLEALFEYQQAKQAKGAWLEYILSFLIGVLSSSLVTFLAISFQNRRKGKQNKLMQPIDN